MGGFAIPFDLVINYENGKTETKHYNPAVWKSNQKSFLAKFTSKVKVKSVKIDNGLFVDATPSDNMWGTK